MASNKVPVAGQLGTTSPTDTYPVFEDVDGLGGFRVVADENAMNAIPAERRKEGMEVKLENGKLYELKNGIFVLKTSIGDIQPLLDLKEDKANKNQPNGYAGLGSDGKVLSSQLPSYIDDIVEYPNKASFPTIGNSSTIYVDLSDGNKQYRWSGTAYAEISSGAVQSVNGKTGIVNIVKADIALGNVDNTSDLNKPISTATQAALDGKSAIGHNHSGLYEPANDNIQTHIADTSTNPHNVTKQQVGLGSVDNTSDLNKPISMATQAALSLKEDKTNKGQANGYAGLDSNSKISATNLPTFVSSVNTRSGDITLSKSDVGLNNVDNTADASKEVLSATKLKTPRTINGVAFDGTQNISIPSAAAGSNTQVMFNDNGALAGSADFTYDKVNKTIKVGELLRFGTSSSGYTGILGIGNNSGKLSTGYNSTVIGNSSVLAANSSDCITSVGYGVMPEATALTGMTVVGQMGFNKLLSGDGSIGMGRSVASRATSINKSIILGDSAASSETSSINNKLIIESDSTRNFNKDYLIEGDFSQRWVRFNGAIRKRIYDIIGNSTSIYTGNATSESDYTISDTSKNFTINELKDKFIIIEEADPTITNRLQVYHIVSNDQTVITVDSKVDPGLLYSSSYKIVDGTIIKGENLNSIYNFELDLEDHVVFLDSSTSSMIGSNVILNISSNNENKKLYVISSKNIDANIPYGDVCEFTSVETKLNVINNTNKWEICIINYPISAGIRKCSNEIIINRYDKIYKMNISSPVTIYINLPYNDDIYNNKCVTIELDINMTVVSSITWPINVTWIGGVSPTFDSIGKYRLVFRTEDAGTTWLGNLAYTY